MRDANYHKIVLHRPDGKFKGLDSKRHRNGTTSEGEALRVQKGHLGRFLEDTGTWEKKER